MPTEKLILVDSHVHIHRCFRLQEFLDHAYNNLSSVARELAESDSFLGVLMLAETSTEQYFPILDQLVRAGSATQLDQNSCSWSFHKTSESCSLLARRDGAVLTLIAGRQVVTSEKLEVLMLGTQRSFQDGVPIRRVLHLIGTCNALAVIPWGAGKWLFWRGHLLNQLIDSKAANQFYLGDQGGRPFFWPTPRHFAKAAEKGIRILLGSDPLPFPAEVERTGSFGFAIRESIDSSRPFTGIKALLAKPSTTLIPFGRLQGTSLFLINQARMQVLKHRKDRFDSSWINRRP